jgi:hypothetical protein
MFDLHMNNEINFFYMFSSFQVNLLFLVHAMDEGFERDNTSGGGGLPTLPGLYLSTIQPSRRGFYRIHVCDREDNWRQYI